MTTSFTIDFPGKGVLSGRIKGYAAGLEVKEHAIEAHLGDEVVVLAKSLWLLIQGRLKTALDVNAGAMVRTSLLTVTGISLRCLST